MNQQESGLFKSLVHRAASRVIYAVAVIFGGGLLVGAVLIKFLLVEDPQLLELLNPSDRQSVVINE